MRCLKSWSLAVMVLPAFAHLTPASPKAAIIQPERSVSGHQSNPWKAFEPDSTFAPVPHSTLVATCESTAPPEPLTTPAPLIDAAAAASGLSVSFIIGTDGLVHSALLLKSVGNIEDRAVLNIVRSWRYRPALCNGVPTETEATVDFSSRRRTFGLE